MNYISSKSLKYYHQENIPKDEKEIQQDMEDLKKENEILAQNALNSNTMKREQQIGDDLFIPILNVEDDKM